MAINTQQQTQTQQVNPTVQGTVVDNPSVVSGAEVVDNAQQTNKPASTETVGTQTSAEIVSAASGIAPQPAGEGSASAVEDSKYAWDKQAEQQAGLQLGIDELTAKQQSMESAQYLQKQRNESQMNAALGKYATAQNIDKYGWTGGGSEFDMGYQLNYMKASISADLYNMAELQKMGIESSLAIARMQYSLNKEQLALEAYDKERAFALQEAATTGWYVSAEARDQLAQQKGAELTLAQYENRLDSLTDAERAEYDRAKGVSEAIDNWFTSQGISKEGQKTFAAIAHEEQMDFQRKQQFLQEAEYMDNLTNAIHEMNQNDKENIWVMGTDENGMPKRVNLSEADADTIQKYFSNAAGELDMNKVRNELNKKTDMSVDNIAQLVKQSGMEGTFDYEGFSYVNGKATLTSISDYNQANPDAQLTDPNSIQEVIEKYGEVGREYVTENGRYTLQADGTVKRSNVSNEKFEIEQQNQAQGTNYASSKSQLGSVSWDDVDRDGKNKKGGDLKTSDMDLTIRAPGSTESWKSGSHVSETAVFLDEANMKACDSELNSKLMSALNGYQTSNAFVYEDKVYLYDSNSNKCYEITSAKGSSLEQAKTMMKQQGMVLNGNKLG